jgi:hypothetical protein
VKIVACGYPKRRNHPLIAGLGISAGSESDNEAVPTQSNDDVVVTIDDSDMIRLSWTDGITITEEAARIAAGFVNQISADRRRPMIVDMALTAQVTRQARTVFLEPGAASIIALLGKSPVDRVIANFVLGVSNLPCPTKFFTSEEAAIAWIRQTESS